MEHHQPQGRNLHATVQTDHGKQKGVGVDGRGKYALGHMSEVNSIHLTSDVCIYFTGM